jgi:23S rRNA (pseudouridine1915-N3)-methyltransferase
MDLRILIAAVGKLKSGPERDLCDRYVERAQKAGRALGLTRIDVREWPEGRATRSDDRKADEADLIASELPPTCRLILLDEHGDNLTSTEFADLIAGQRDAGLSDLVFAIGGPDGHGPALGRRADRKLAFGAMTWPHQIVRVLLAEQIYRAATILSGHPYHRV